MNAIKSACYKILSSNRILQFSRAIGLSGKIMVLMYHEVADDHDAIEAWTVVKKSDFVRQMDYLRKHFRPIGLTEAIELMQHPHAVDGARPPAVITFDDGYAGNRTIALPILQSMDIPVTVFVASQAIQDQSLYWYDRIINGIQGRPAMVLDLGAFSLGTYRINHSEGSANWIEIQRLLTDLKRVPPVERAKLVEHVLGELNRLKSRSAYQMRPLTLKELQELAASPLVTIGAHSHCHNLLTQLTHGDAETSIRTSKQLLESWTRQSVDHFAYPNGSYNDAVVATVKAAGLSSGLTTVAQPWNPADSLFTIPRIGIGRYDSFDYFTVKVSGVLSALHALRR